MAKGNDDRRVEQVEDEINRLSAEDLTRQWAKTQKPDERGKKK